MTAVISCTNDSLYSYFIPIVAWCWNRIGVDVILFTPHKPDKALWFAMNEMNKDGSNRNKSFGFVAPADKQATYAQCSRLYAACLDLPGYEVIIIGDCDMANFKVPPDMENEMVVFGGDLVPEGQYPMCYAVASARVWRSAMKLHDKTYQEELDFLLGDINCENMRGNYWSKDQQTLWENTCDIAITIPRARPGTQFADHRVDRDDINWRAYVNENLIDAHLWRPGYTDENFPKILELLQTMYPAEDFTWLINYTNAYKKLL